MAAICHWRHFKPHQLECNREMRLGMPRAARRTAYLERSVHSVNPVLPDLLSSRRLFAPGLLGNENSHFFKWLFTKMAVSMVSGREYEQQLAESHLMLISASCCSRTLGSVSGHHLLSKATIPHCTHSFSEDWGKCNKIGNPSISDFSTVLTSHLLILADIFYLLGDEAYRQRLSLPCYRLSTPCYECKPKARHFFDKFFIKAWFCCGSSSLSFFKRSISLSSFGTRAIQVPDQQSMDGWHPYSPRPFCKAPFNTINSIDNSSLTSSVSMDFSSSNMAMSKGAELISIIHSCDANFQILWCQRGRTVGAGKPKKCVLRQLEGYAIEDVNHVIASNETDARE